jgi:type II secretory pathway component PulL
VSSKTLLIHLTPTRLATAVLDSTLSGHTLGAVQESPLADESTLAEGPWDRVIVTLAAECALFRLLELPFRDRGRLAQAIGPSLEEHVPLSLEEGRVAFDHAGPHADGHVLAAIVRNADLAAAEERIQALGTTATRVVWAAPLVLSPYRRAAGETPSYAIVDASADGAVVAAIRDGALVGLRVVAPAGDEHLLRSVLRALRALPIQPETLWLGGARADQLADQLSDNLAGATIHRLDNRPPLGSVVAQDQEAADWSNLAPLAGLATLAAGEAESPVIDFSSAAGSGLAEVVSELRPLLPWAAALVAISLLGWGVQTYRLWDQRSDLQAKAEAIYQDVTGENSGGVGRRLRLEMRLSELTGRRADDTTGASPLSILTALSDAIPDDLEVELHDFRHAPDVVRVHGRADSFETITRVEEALRGSERFDDVEVRDAHATAAGDGIDFQMLIRSGQMGKR